MRSLLFFLFAVMAVSPAAGQSTFVPSDGSMDPDLTSGTTYTLSHVDSTAIGRIVVFTRNSQQVARRIIGGPKSKVLTQDPDFTLRVQTSWSFVSIVEDTILSYGSQTPIPDPPPSSHTSLSGLTPILGIGYQTMRQAAALGDSLYYVHALQRPALAPGATRTAAQGADSREWGTVHARDFVGIIIPP